MPTYDPNGKARYLMEQLDQGAMSRAEIVSWASQAFNKGAVKIPHVLQAVQTEGWVRPSFSSGYYLTEAGKAALGRLCRGEVVSSSAARTSVRVFGRAA